MWSELNPNLLFSLWAKTTLFYLLMFKVSWEIQSSNCAWCAFSTSGFRWAGGTRSVPRLLFLLRFRVSFGRSIGLPCWSTGWGQRAWCKIFQHYFVALGLQMCTIPGRLWCTFGKPIEDCFHEAKHSDLENSRDPWLFGRYGSQLHPVKSVLTLAQTPKPYTAMSVY